MSTDDKAHTPGPWHATLHQVGDENNVRVADCYSLEKGHDTARANARLIAAAPDLLAALEALLLLADPCESAVGVARAAIAKARGEQA